MAIDDLKRYSAAKAAVLRRAGGRCEVCRPKRRAKPATHVHHLIGVGESGIGSDLIFAQENMVATCDDCHGLFHPGIRQPWAVGNGVHRRRALLKR